MSFNTKPTESELEILQVLWEYGPQSVRFVYENISKSKDTGYTTTLKIMQLMLDKDLLARDTSSRSHIYSAKISQDKTQNQLLNRFINKTFRGSASKLVMQALGSHQPSSEELQKIKNLIDQIEKQQ